MNSTDKIRDFLETLAEQEDHEITQALPLPPSVLRMGIAAMHARVPNDPEQIDEWALAAANFCLSMRSDNAPAVALQPAGVTVGELAAAEEPV